LGEPLPHSRHTLDSPHPDKWRRNADELEPQLDHITPSAQRALEVFAERPRTAPVQTRASADRERAAPVMLPAAIAPPPTSPEAELFGSQHSGSFRALLDAVGGSLVVSTYQAGRLIMVRSAEQGLNSHFRALATPMGIAYDGQRLAVGTRGEI